MARLKKQPNEDEQRELAGIIDNEPSEVVLRGKRFKVGALYNGTIAKLRKITNGDHKDELMVSAKCAAAILLNGYWSIKFLWWLRWRWYYYVKQYTDDELQPVIDAAKKKVPLLGYYKVTISLIEMRDTIATMTREEVKRFQAGLLTEQRTQ